MMDPHITYNETIHKKLHIALSKDIDYNVRIKVNDESIRDRNFLSQLTSVVFTLIVNETL